MDASGPKKRILILGGGFGGVYTALHLERLCNRRQDALSAFLPPSCGRSVPASRMAASGRNFGKLIVRVDGGSKP